MDSEGFNTIDRPVARDRFDDFKTTVTAQLEYRRAYNELAAANPAEALKHPHPDSHDFNPAQALEGIKRAGGTLTTDARVDIQG